MISTPQPLANHLQLADFDGGEPSLDDCLKRRAAKNQVNGSSRTYVVCDGETVMGYYCLAAGAIGHAEAPASMKRNRPDPVPVLVLGRLAIHKIPHQTGIGTALLNDVIGCAMRAAEIAGVTALLTHAILEQTRRFCLARLHRVARQADDAVPDARHGRPGVARAAARNHQRGAKTRGRCRGPSPGVSHDRSPGSRRRGPRRAGAVALDGPGAAEGIGLHALAAGSHQGVDAGAEVDRLEGRKDAHSRRDPDHRADHHALHRGNGPTNPVPMSSTRIFAPRALPGSTTYSGREVAEIADPAGANNSTNRRVDSVPGVLPLRASP